jgi:phage-related minor tail protein
VWPILLIVAAVAAVIAILMNWGAITDWLKEMWDGFVAFIKRIPGAWVDAAKAMIDGLVKGIKDGAAAVWKAMSDLAGGAIDSFKSKLGIKSPSVVMRATMQHVTDGAVLGAEDGIGEIESAGASMATAVTDGASSVKAAPSNGGATATRSAPLIGQVIVNANTKEDAQSIADTIVATLERAYSMSGGEAPAT